MVVTWVPRPLHCLCSTYTLHPVVVENLGRSEFCLVFVTIFVWGCYSVGWTQALACSLYKLNGKLSHLLPPPPPPRPDLSLSQLVVVLFSIFVNNERQVEAL